MNWFKRTFQSKKEPGDRFKVAGDSGANTDTNTYHLTPITSNKCKNPKGFDAALFLRKSLRICAAGLLNDGGKRGCGGQYRRLPAGRQESLPSQLKLQSFFFSWLDKEGDCEKYEPYYRKHNAQGNRKIKKEFACQRYSKDGFRDISEIARREFSSGIVDKIFHIANIYHISRGSSNDFVGDREVEHELV
ncbi:MAG: hypothetical protein HZA28_08580 [Candidatus Omnitrophica bacterium]|nr:hypothetical protein [Candidatus Omnitrophota bacterium]